MNKKVSYTYQYLSRTETKIKECVRMIYNIIQSVTEKLSSLPFIEGIVLGGSRARGTHTEDSDIDIGIVNGKPFVSCKR